MSQPRAISRTISALPDELLLKIGAQLTHLQRNTDLANLALASKRWRPIAQEWLLRSPRLNLRYIYLYIKQLGYKTNLIPLVSTLDIWSTSAHRLHYDHYGLQFEPCVPVTGPFNFVEQHTVFLACIQFIDKYGRSERDKMNWKDACKYPTAPALFAILICMLPNLKELKVAEVWLLDFPLFSSLFRQHGRTLYVPAPLSRASMFAGALDAIAEKLEVLEVPADLIGLNGRHGAGILFEYRRLENLKELGITMRSIRAYRTQAGRPYPWENIFPRSLEILKVSEATHHTPIFIDGVCLAKTNGHLPNLRIVKVYYDLNIFSVKHIASSKQYPDPVTDLLQSCSKANIALYVYFPSWTLSTWDIGGSPFRLGTEAGALRIAERMANQRRMIPSTALAPVYEAAWDKDGDVLML